MCHLFSVEFQKFLQPSNFFSVCSYNCFALSNKNTLPLLSPLSTPPLLPASLRQWLYSHQPLIMFSAHFLSLARLHFSLKIHNSSCDHGTPPRIQLSTSGRGGGGSPLTPCGYENASKWEGKQSVQLHGLSTQTGWRKTIKDKHSYSHLNIVLVSILGDFC